MIGLSGTYAVNAVDICPEGAQWIERATLGTDGNGHPIYSSVKEFEFTWGFMSMSDYNALYSARQLVGSTGTVTVDLPDLSQADFRFKRYSGTVIHEPSVGQFFTDHLSDVRLLISNIRVT